MERFGPGAGAKLCENVRHARRDSSSTGLLRDAIAPVRTMFLPAETESSENHQTS